MKITIDLDENDNQGFAPSFIYRKLCDEYFKKKTKEVKNDLWAGYHYSDECARQLFAQLKKGRTANVKSLILTYKDSEDCFKIFKSFVDTWANEYISRCNLRDKVQLGMEKQEIS